MSMSTTPPTDLPADPSPGPIDHDWPAHDAAEKPGNAADRPGDKPRGAADDARDDSAAESLGRAVIEPVVGAEPPPAKPA